MALQIRIVPDALRAAAEQQRELQQNVETSVGAIGAIRDVLQESWESAAGVHAADVLSEIRAAVKRIADGIGEDAAKLDDIASAFEMVDKEDQPVIVRLMPTGLVPTPINPAFIWAQIGSVRIIPDNVRDAAARCKKVADQMEEVRMRFKVILERLRENWEGRSCNKYLDEIMETIDALHHVVNALDSFADRLRFAAMKYEDLDNSL